eukprot:31479-Pelagococcus_subviridis.AAC.11
MGFAVCSLPRWVNSAGRRSFRRCHIAIFPIHKSPEQHPVASQKWVVFTTFGRTHEPMTNGMELVTQLKKQRNYT